MPFLVFCANCQEESDMSVTYSPMKMLVTVLIRFWAMTIQMTMRLPHVETVAIETKSTDQISCRHHGSTYAFTSSASYQGRKHSGINYLVNCG